MKKHINPTLYLLLFLLFVSGTIWALRFAHNRHDERVCGAVKVSIDHNRSHVFITEDEIMDQLLASQLHPTGNLTAGLNMHAIEAFLHQHCAIQNVNVFTHLSGEVNIEIVQRQPIVRVENAQRQQFYVTSDGHLMATNPKHTARLIIANGHIFDLFTPNQNILKPANDTLYTAPTLHRIYQIVTHIRNNEFLNDLIEQIYINKKNEFELIPRVGNKLILLGNAENYEDQLRRLELFYQHGIKKVGWGAYRIINLKYNNQVVCTKT